MTVIEDIASERERQKTTEGWTLAHDDAHESGEMAGAAACYIMNGLRIGNEELFLCVKKMVDDLWPWAKGWWKPKDRRRDLIRAAALIVAEIERLDRKSQTP